MRKALKNERPTIKSFMSGDKCASQRVTGFIKQIFKVQLALLTKSVFHFLGTTGVFIGANTQIFACKRKTKQKYFYITAELIKKIKITLDQVEVKTQTV